MLVDRLPLGIEFLDGSANDLNRTSDLLNGFADSLNCISDHLRG